jgi:glycosyltransferase involved in cell wall biosynthesis
VTAQPLLESEPDRAADSASVASDKGVSGVPIRLPDRVGGPRIPSIRKFRVLFVVRPGVWDGVSMRYRGYNIIEALRLAGIEADHLDDRYVIEHLDEALAYDLIVLVRRQMTPEIARLLDAAERFSVPVVFELDDYLFDDEIIPYVEMYRALPIDEARREVRKWRDLLERCDFYTGSTEHLTERAAAIGKASYFIHNGLNVATIELSRRALEGARRGSERRGLRLGYVSGSNTHQQDFREIAPVILRLMDEFPTLELLVRGCFELAEFPEFVRFGARVQGRPFIDWRQVPAEIARIDINLVPLEINTFTNAKSDLKYIEAALLKVPSVASPTRPYLSCITHGVNGFIARSPDEWYDALRALIVDPDLRRRMGERAHHHALAAYGPGAIAEEALTAYRSMLAHHRRTLGVEEGAATVVVLIGDLDRALRDHDPAIGLAFALARAGATVAVLITDGPAGLTAAGAWQSIIDHLSEPPFAVQVDHEIPCCDILLATDPLTAHRAKRSEHRAGWVAYLVAGYPSVDLPPGGESDRTAGSYELGLDLLALDPDVVDRLSRHDRAGVHLLPAWVERPVVAAACYDPQKILIAATGRVSEHTWIEVLAALDRVHAERQGVEIVLCGIAPDDVAPARFPHRGLARTYGPEFEGLIAERPVCVVLHDSGPPRWRYDLMAAGCPVIAVGPHAGGRLAAAERDAGFIGVDADAPALANAIDSLLIDPVRLGRLLFLAADLARDLLGPSEAAGVILRAFASAAVPSHSPTHVSE